MIWVQCFFFFQYLKTNHCRFIFKNEKFLKMRLKNLSYKFLKTIRRKIENKNSCRTFPLAQDVAFTFKAQLDKVNYCRQTSYRIYSLNPSHSGPID